LSYQVEVPKPIAKELREHPRETRRAIGYAIHRLSDNPRPVGAKKLEGGRDRYRIRIGDWRVIYAIEDRKLLVLVLRVADRKEVYRRL
jgi:mRNA interferase RelE/StbE